MSDSSESNDPLKRPFRGFSRDAAHTARGRIHGHTEPSEPDEEEERDDETDEDTHTNEDAEEVIEEDGPQQSEEVVAGIAKVKAAFGGRGLFARTESGEPLVIPSQSESEPELKTETASLSPGHEKDRGTREELRDKKEAYLNQLATEKWGENHNRARKAYTVALETHLHARILLAQTEVRIRLGEERLQAERRKKLGESTAFKEVEREMQFNEALENDTSYQREVEKMADEVVRIQAELHAEDPSFDASSAVTMNSELYALLAPHLDEKMHGPAREIFDAMSTRVLTPEEEALLGDTIVDMYYVQRSQYLAGYQAHLIGHSRPRAGVLLEKESEFSAIKKAYNLTQKAVERMLKKEGFPTAHLKVEDAEVINKIRQYWLSGFKKARVPKTAEKVRQQKKGGLGRFAAAVIAFIGAWSYDPNAPQEPQVRYEQDNRDSREDVQNGEEVRETVEEEAISVPAQRTGAIDTFSILLSQMTPEAREALYQGLERSAGGTLTTDDRALLSSARENQDSFSHGALFVARQLGFVKENRQAEPRIYADSTFVFDEQGVHVVRGNRDQLLVDATYQKVANYRDR